MEAAEEAARAIEATGVCPTAEARPVGGRTTDQASARPAAEDTTAAVAADEAEDLEVGEAGAALTAADAAVGAPAVASVPAVPAAAVGADSVPTETHRSASGMVPCPPLADRSPLVVCPS